MENVRRWRSGATISAAAFVLALIVLAAGSIFAGVNGSEAVAALTPSASPTPTATAEPEEEGCTTWATAPSDYGNNRWFAEGIAEIKNASTDAEATEAAHVWLAEVRKDPSLLAGTAKYFLQRDVDPATLSTDGCATDAAVQLVTELELAISTASITPEDAPANGYNTGVNDGAVVGSATPGITGDRSAVKIRLSDGRVIWIMARCGNIVTTEPPVVPPGPTDEPPPPPPEDCPPGQVRNVNGECVVPKSDDPTDYRQPGDGGKGAGVGTGTKPPATVTTPAETTPPAVETSVTGGGGVVDTPTSAPASETGVTAPDAEPAPATASPTPVNEGGDNDGVVSGP